MNRFSPLKFANNDQPDQPGVKSLPLIPGPHLYSDTVKGTNKATIISTSITREFDMKDFNNKYIGGTAYLHKFHGGKAKNLKQYVPIHMADEKSDSIIVVGGGNDLPGKETVLQTANHLMEAGLQGKRMGATRVLISSVLPRENFYHQTKRHELNKLLRDLCVVHGFIFIDNRNIILDTHILNDGVHLNSSGTKLLEQNLLSHLNA